VRILRDGSWNSADHLLTRFADAGISILLIWMLAPESFSRLALAQAVAAPLLVFFLSPENVLYRDFAAVRALGAPGLRRHLSAFRRFAVAKAVFSVVPAALVAMLPWAGGLSPSGRFWGLLWALGWALSPQVSGPDRLFLRLDLRWRSLVAHTLFQKLSLVVAMVLAVRWGRGDLATLAWATWLSLALSAGLALLLTELSLVRSPLAAPPAAAAPARRAAILLDSIRGFSFWAHLNGVLYGWSQTLDLFFLGVFPVAARDVGLYAVALKYSNFLLALPQGLMNLFNVWLGRTPPATGSEAVAAERRRALRLSGWLLAGMVAAALLFRLAAPFVFRLFAHGRWVEADTQRMAGWLTAILVLPVAISALNFIDTWLTLRRSVRALLLEVGVPTLIVAGAGVAWAVRAHGVVGAAWSNPWVAAVYAVLLLRLWRRG